jgi:hypothetical protein
MALAEVYLKLDRAIEADAVCQRAVRIADSAFGRYHPRTAEILSVRGAGVAKGGQTERSERGGAASPGDCCLPVDEWKLENNRVQCI